MVHNEKNCPWCGKEFTTDVGACPHCGWSRRGSNGRRAIFIYAGFILFMMLLGAGVLLYAFKQVSSPINSLTGTPVGEGVKK